MSTEIINVKAKLHLYSTEKGGRKTGIANKYRPNHVMEYLSPKKDRYPTTYIGQIEFDYYEIYPGETRTVFVKFLDHQNICDFIQIGRIWWIHEGEKCIGEAEILDILT